MRSFKPDVQLLGPVLAEMFTIVEGQDVDDCDAWVDRNGKPRRLRARYANGWTVEVRLSGDGRVTSSQASYTVRMTSRRGGAQ